MFPYSYPFGRLLPNKTHIFPTYSYPFYTFIIKVWRVLVNRDKNILRIAENSLPFFEYFCRKRRPLRAFSGFGGTLEKDAPKHLHFLKICVIIKQCISIYKPDAHKNGRKSPNGRQTAMDFLKRTWAEIHLDRLAVNVNNYKKYLPESTELLCVVKASCYGHADLAVCPYLEKELGVGWFAVSNADEALRLRNMGIMGEILVLGYTPPEAVPELADHNIIQTITDERYAEDINACVAGTPIRCHAAIDTGMTRIGLRGTPEEIAASLYRISDMDDILLDGIFTHYAVADSSDPDCASYTAAQTEKFFAVRDEAEKLGVQLRQCHCLNSAGGVYSPDGRSTLARLGIILYGLYPDPATPLPFEPEPVMELYSTVSQVKRIEAGEYVSYGRTFRADKPMTIATVTCGYADGYPRALSNKGEVLIRGKRAKIIGRICMDQFMIDVTDIEGVSSHDTVTLIGGKGNDRITADDIAAWAGTIGYEITCGITSRVPRVVFRGGVQQGVYKI